MNYITHYETCALFFLLAVATRFFGMRKFHNKSNRLFSMLLYCSVVNISLDIVSAYLINNMVFPSIELCYILVTVFYITEVAISLIFFLYIMSLSRYDFPKTTMLLLIPAIAVELTLLTNPFTKDVFLIEKTVDGATFTRGSLFSLLYITGIFYVLLALGIVINLRQYYRKIEVRSTFLFAVIIVISIILQVVFPNILITGVAMSVTIFMMFLTLQNPEKMLDSITGTFNNTALIDYLRKLIFEERSLLIVAIDISGIRRINSIMGIHTGNAILEKVGEFINSICKNHAMPFRLIGTRFIIVSESYRIHNLIIRKLSERFEQPWRCEDISVMLTATIRYCEQKNKFAAPEDVTNLIDIIYSKISEDGFGTTKPIDIEQLEQFYRNGQIKDALERALSCGTGFYLCYQPIYSVTEKKFCGAEALLRLNDPLLGEISPAEFIPVAESTDMICEIDSIVVKMACEFLKSHPELSESGLKLLEINLSAIEFNCDIEKTYNDITQNIESLEGQICFEVTETAVTNKPKVLSDFMYRLIEKGVHFAIDDFGTGYANITQLAKFPFSVVKLDKIFVSQTSPKETKILRDLIEMFDHIGLMTVLEGVETEEEALFSEELGADRIQGFYYSPPLSEEEFVRLMTENNHNHNSED